MPVKYRAIIEEDLPALRLIQQEALRWLASREGRDLASIPLTSEPSSEMRHLLHTDPDSCWLAMGGEGPVGFSLGSVRDNLWFLACLYVHPSFHGMGIGQALLSRCLEAGLQRGAQRRAVASSTHAAAQSLYIRAGMVPRMPLFILEGPADALTKLAAMHAPLVTVAASRESVAKLSELDAELLMRRRDSDHLFWLSDAALPCRVALDQAGKVDGYVYYGVDRTGPLVARGPRTQLALLSVAAQAMAKLKPEHHRLWVPGINATALNALLEAGFRIDVATILMASRPLSRLDRYIASGGMLL